MLDTVIDKPPILRPDLRGDIVDFFGKTETLRVADDVKVLTGNSPEVYLDNMGYSFEEVFGLDRSMKALMALINDKFTGQNCWLFDAGIYYAKESGVVNRIIKNDLFFEMAAQRNRLRREKSDISYELLLEFSNEVHQEPVK